MSMFGDIMSAIFSRSSSAAAAPSPAAAAPSASPAPQRAAAPAQTEAAAAAVDVAAIRAAQRVLAALKEDGDTNRVEADLATFQQREDAVGTARWRFLEEKYLRLGS